MHPEIQIHKAGDGEALIDWYNEGAGGKIQWGQPGDFDACVAIAGKYLDNPEGFCQLRHIDATGKPTGLASGEIGKATEPDYTKLISDRKGEPADQDLYDKVISDAKSKFDVYPSAVANGWVVQEYKRRGGKYRKPVKKGDVPGHDFHGNQYQKFNAGKWREANNMAKWHSFQSANPRLSNDGRVNEHERAGFWHTQAAQQARLMVNKTHEAQQQQMWTKLAEAHENAAKTHYGSYFQDGDGVAAPTIRPDVADEARQATVRATYQRFPDREIVGMGLKKSAPFSGRFPNAPATRTQTYIDQAKALAEKADGFRRLEKWQSAKFAHTDAADAYRKAAKSETDGNAEILNAQADAQDRLAKYCDFFETTPQNSPAEIGKAHGNVPAYPGTSYENPPFKAGSQDWGWLGEGLSTKTPEYNYAPTGNDLPDESSAEPHSDWQSEDAQ